MPDYNIDTEQVRHIAHEIRNQLSICDIYSEIIRKHLIKNNIQNSSIDNALNCIQNAIRLIGNNLIDLKSNTNFTPRIYESDKLLKECIEMAKVYIGDKKIAIEAQIVPEAKIFIDENKFQGCIINILKNAIEAILNSGFIKIVSECTANNLIIKISNNGEEIPEKMQKSIFADGFTTKVSGSGVGLYLCKQNIESMGGNLKLVKSSQDLTEFEISVPLFK